MIVVDASAVLEVLLQSPESGPISAQILAGDEDPHAPHLLDVEVTQVIRRLAASGEIEDQRAEEALTDLTDLPLERHPHMLLLPRAWDLRHNLTIYDGVYVALAELLRAPLLTRDRRLQRAAGGLAEIRVL